MQYKSAMLSKHTSYHMFVLWESRNHLIAWNHHQSSPRRSKNHHPAYGFTPTDRHHRRTSSAKVPAAAAATATEQRPNGARPPRRPFGQRLAELRGAVFARSGRPSSRRWRRRPRPRRRQWQRDGKYHKTATHTRKLFGIISAIIARTVNG